MFYWQAAPDREKITFQLSREFLSVPKSIKPKAA